MEEQNGKKDKLERKPSKEFKDAKIGTGMKLKERWLLTRKTWRYMNDAGKKLFPEGANPQKGQDLPKFEEQFQQACQKSKHYILWSSKFRNIENPPVTTIQADEEDRYEYIDGDSEDLHEHGGFDIPFELYSQLLKNYGANTLNRVASKLMEEQLIEEEEEGYDEEGEYIEVDGRIMRSIGSQTDPYLEMCVQTDYDEGAEDFVKVGAETRAETEAAVVLQRALMQQQYERELIENNELAREEELLFGRKLSLSTTPHMLQLQEPQLILAQEHLQQQLQLQQAHFDQQDQQQQQQFFIIDQEQTSNLSKQSFSDQRESSQQEQKSLQQQTSLNEQQQQQQTQQPQQQPFQHQQQTQPPVLRKFWARRESLTAKNEAQLSQQIIQSSSDKDREPPLPKGSVAAKLASLESTGTTSPTTTTTTRPEAGAKHADQPKQYNQQPYHQPEKKKSLQSVFKLGLKCDLDNQPGTAKVSVGKSQMDKFKTVNYDKTLRDIKSKWVPTVEEAEFIKFLQRENEQEKNRVKEMKLKEKERIKAQEKEEKAKEKQEKLKEKEKEKEKKKKKARAIQVGEPLPQFILNSLRINSPVQIIHATKKRFRKLSSKAESVDLSGSECSMPPSGVVSPRFPVSILEEQGPRNLTVSESEAYKLSQMGVPFEYRRQSIDSSSEQTGVGRHQFQKTLSAIQASGHISQILYNIKSSCLSQLSNTANAGVKAEGSQKLLQSFLQHLLPSVMQRSRTPASGQTSRLVGKRIWRTRSKSQSRASSGTTSIWSPMGNNTWMSVTGRVSTLEPTTLLQLTELERLTLQKISLAKIQALNLGCTIRIPKEVSESSGNKKRRSYLLKRKSRSTGFFETKKEDNKGSFGGLVFGLPLVKCLENERSRRGETSDRESAQPEDGEVNLSRKNSQVGSHNSFTSLLDGGKQSTMGSLESLNLERKRPSIVGGDVIVGGSPTSFDLLMVDPPQVPALVSTCCKYLEGYGLNTLGIFRVSSSKKRVRQLREEFDSGKEVSLSEQSPHDVATLLKEFFRDLPEPLLTRELYEPLLQTQKIRHRRLQFEALQYLVQLLPTINRDTLYSLLNFLTRVAEHAADSDSDVSQGNRMDSNNLATLFAPNILHQMKPGSDSLSTAEMTAQAQERIDVINVVRTMIDHNKELFEVTPELLDETFQHLMDTHPEALDILLHRHCTNLDEPDYEIDTTSVFDGSDDASSPSPLSPTDHRGFERLRAGVTRGIEEHEGKDKIGSYETVAGRSLASDATMGRWNSDKRSSGCEILVHGEEKGWFKSREKSQSRELDKGTEEHGAPERSRWFRRRDKTSPKSHEEKGLLRKGSGKLKMQSKPDAGTSSQESLDSQPDRCLRVPEPTVRRLSSPELDTYGIITASLKIPVPLQQQGYSVSSKRERDIPYIEDGLNYSESGSSRQRTGSNDSYLGQPITGIMSFQQLMKTDIEKQSRDSALSSSSIGMLSSCSDPNTPDFIYASESSTPLSGVMTPPIWLSPDSGTPGLSPHNSPPMQRRHHRRREDSRMIHPTMQTISNPKSWQTQQVREKSTIRPLPNLPSSHASTTETLRTDPDDEESRVHTEVKGKLEGAMTVRMGFNQTVGGAKDTTKKYIRKTYTGDMHRRSDFSDTNSGASNSENNSPQLWKRWEIIASDPTEPETYV